MRIPPELQQDRFNPVVAANLATNRWLVSAVIYFVIAVGLGIFMGASGDHRLSGMHAHLNLLGWVSMALIGFIYRAWPAAAVSRLAKTQFWIYSIALPPMMIALGFKLLGHHEADPVLGITSMAMGVSALLFAINILRQPRG